MFFGPVWTSRSSCGNPTALRIPQFLVEALDSHTRLALVRRAGLRRRSRGARRLCALAYARAVVRKLHPVGDQHRWQPVLL